MPAVLRVDGYRLCSSVEIACTAREVVLVDFPLITVQYLHDARVLPVVGNRVEVSACRVKPVVMEVSPYKGVAFRPAGVQCLGLRQQVGIHGMGTCRIAACMYPVVPVEEVGGQQGAVKAVTLAGSIDIIAFNIAVIDREGEVIAVGDLCLGDIQLDESEAGGQVTVCT